MRERNNIEKIITMAQNKVINAKDSAVRALNISVLTEMQNPVQRQAVRKLSRRQRLLRLKPYELAHRRMNAISGKEASIVLRKIEFKKTSHNSTTTFNVKLLRYCLRAGLTRAIF
jgi:hypothetical protein